MNENTQPFTIPALFRAIMAEKGWSRKDLANGLGISTHQLDQWLYGTKCPMWDSIVPRLERIGILSFKVF